MLIFQQSDEDLMALAALDQNGPFDELVRRYENRLLATAYRSIRNHDTAEDIVQEVFITVWEERRRFDKNIAKFSTWIYTILQNKITDYLRRRYLEKDNISLSMVEEDKDVLASVLDDQSGREGSKRWFDELSENQMAKVKEIVLRYLDKDDQLLFQLKDENGLSYKEIKQKPLFKGVSIATLKKRRQYLKEKIIEALEIEKYNKSGK
jgi:RNA polymerase sigma-70 factor (ECF subfamily)